MTVEDFVRNVYILTPGKVGQKTRWLKMLEGYTTPTRFRI